jgi:DNA mismatch repair protein MutL
MLAFPIHFSMNQSTLSLFLPHQKDLELMGFAFGKVDVEGVEITAVHSSITADQIPAFLESLLDDLQHQPKPDNQDLKEYLAKIASKFGSIRSGVELHAAAQTGLIDDLFACQTPDRCPDGTPIFVVLSSEQIDKKFNP